MLHEVTFSNPQAMDGVLHASISETRVLQNAQLAYNYSHLEKLFFFRYRLYDTNAVDLHDFTQKKQLPYSPSGFFLWLLNFKWFVCSF